MYQNNAIICADFLPCSCSVSCGLLSASAGCKCPSLNWGSSRQWALVVSSPAWQHGWAMLWYFIYIGMTLSYFSYIHYIYQNQNQNVCFIVTEYCCSTTAQCSHIISTTWCVHHEAQSLRISTLYVSTPIYTISIYWDIQNLDIYTVLGLGR